MQISDRDQKSGKMRIQKTANCEVCRLQSATQYKNNILTLISGCIDNFSFIIQFLFNKIPKFALN